MKKNFLLLIAFFFFQNTFSQFQKKIIPGIPQLNNTKSCSGDINHDGLIDLVLMGEETDRFVTSIYINRNDHFSPMLIPEMKNLSNGTVSLIDFNNDNYLDLLITGNTKSGSKHSILFKNINGTSFKKINTPFEKVNYNAQAWFDYNNDGYLDLILSGLNEENKITCNLYINNNGTFSTKKTNLISVHSGTIKAIDYNNDSYTDILIMGITEGAKRVSYLYRNDQNSTFTKIIELEGLSNGDAEWGDYNNDGYSDLAIAGYNGKDYIAQIYTNNKGSLQLLKNLDHKLGNSDLEWINYDGDKDLDLLHTGGLNNTFPKTVLYKNNNSNFEEISTIFDQLYRSCICVEDFNDDGKIDIFISGAKIPEGPFSSFYFNKNTFTLSKPPTPTIIKASVNYPDVTLKWSIKNKPLNNLKFRLKIGSSDNNSSFFPFPTNIQNNKSISSNAYQLSTSKITIKNMTEGKYYWSVQSVDINGTISDLSSSDFFYVNAPYNLGKDKNICIKDQVELNVPSGNYTVDWLVDSKKITNKNSIKFQVNNDSKVIVKLNKNYGGIVYDTIKINCRYPNILNLPSKITSCYNELVTLTSSSKNAKCKWLNFKKDILSNSKIYEFKNIKKDSIILMEETTFGCISYDTCKISVNQLPKIKLNNEYFTCKNNFLKITCEEYPKIEWYSSENKLLLKNSSTFKQKVSTTSNYYLIVEDKNRCQAKKGFKFIPYALPTALAGRDTLICKGNTILIGPEKMAKGGTIPYKFSWEHSDNLNNIRSNHPEFIANENSKFILKVTDQNGCHDSDTVNYYINPVSQIDIGKNQIICQGDGVQLGGSPTAKNSLRKYKYTWNPSTGLDDAHSSNPFASPSTTTEYELTVTTHTCKAYQKKIKITVNKAPKLTTISDTIVGANEEFRLWAKGAAKYSWSPSIMLDNATCKNPKLKLTKNTIFSVVGFSNLGCKSDSKSIQISINNELFIPSLFTPNNDGKNDLFLIYSTGIKELKLRIYNNFGSIIFQSNNYKQIQSSGWDGTNNGQNSPEGNYIWELEGKYSDGRYWRKTGTIYLMR